VSGSSFYDPGAFRHVAINLFNGWGYNFYRRENQLRADDQLIRAKAAWLLGLAHACLDELEQTWRREKLPAPSRAHPYPDPAAVEGARTLERLAKAVGGLVGRLHAQPAPENDRMTERYRREAETLIALAACDEQLVGQSEMLRSALDGKEPDWALDNAAFLGEGVAAIEETLRQRQMILS
jgi:hypothetical protein